MTEPEQQCENWNVYKCSCGEAVNKKDKDRHDAEQHSSNTCKYCGKTDLAYLLAKHACPKPPQICEFCEGTFLFELYEEHVEMCGSKTNQCEKCKKYVRLRDFKAHQEAGDCELPAQESTDGLEDTDFRLRNRDDQGFRTVPLKRREEVKKEELVPRSNNGPKKPRTFLIYHTSTKVIRPKRAGGVSKVSEQERNQYRSVDTYHSRPPQPVDPIFSLRQSGKLAPGRQKPKGLKEAAQSEDLDEDSELQEALRRSQIEL